MPIAVPCLIDVKEFIINLINFYKIYPDEAACEHALKEFRESHTLYSPECGGLHLSWHPSHKSWDMYGLRP